MLVARKNRDAGGWQMSGTLTVTGLATGLLSGEKVIGPITMSGSATVGEIRDLALAAGDNTIPVPAGASAVVVVVAPTSGTISLRTNLNSTDAGLPFGPTGWLAIALASGTTSLILNASAPASVEVSFI